MTSGPIQRTIARQLNGYVAAWLWFIGRDGERVECAHHATFHDEDEANAWADGMVDFYEEAISRAS